MLIGVLLLLFKIAAQERPLMVEHPGDAGLGAIDLQPLSEIIRAQVPLHGEETESITTRVIKSNGTAVEGDDTMQGLGNSAQEGLLGQVRNDGIVDFKERAITLCVGHEALTVLRTVHVFV